MEHGHVTLPSQPNINMGKRDDEVVFDDPSDTTATTQYDWTPAPEHGLSIITRVALAVALPLVLIFILSTVYHIG